MPPPTHNGTGNTPQGCLAKMNLTALGGGAKVTALERLQRLVIIDEVYPYSIRNTPASDRILKSLDKEGSADG